MLIVFLIMVPVLALVALEIKNLLSAVIVLSAFSLVLSLIFYYLHAPDVAIAEAAIGSGFATVIFLIAIKKRGVLIMLTYPHSRFFYYDDKGRPAGFEILLDRQRQKSPTSPRRSHRVPRGEAAVARGCRVGCRSSRAKRR